MGLLPPRSCGVLHFAAGLLLHGPIPFANCGVGAKDSGKITISRNHFYTPAFSYSSRGNP